MEGQVTNVAVEPFSAGSLISLVVSLVLVLLVFFMLAWVMKRLQYGARGAGGAIRVISDMPLGPKERVVLVEVGGTQLLLGLTPGSVRALHTLETPIAEEKPLSQPSTGFAERLRATMMRRQLS